ncbi:MAG: hypothetical protein U9R42_07655 [Bacteroidota bacterium]|nr:hypothetical protein [Bacteroidota bacterium]
MKILNILIFYFLLLLTQCDYINNDENKENNIDKLEYQIISTVNKTKIINVINNNICFKCCPSLYMNRISFDKKNSNIEVIYIFPYLRSIQQNKFLKENLDIEKNDSFQIYFNDSLYNRFKSKYSLGGSSLNSYLVILDAKGNYQTYKYEREKLVKIE